VLLSGRVLDALVDVTRCCGARASDLRFRGATGDVTFHRVSRRG
jgi:hypothetical protein